MNIGANPFPLLHTSYPATVVFKDVVFKEVLSEERPLFATQRPNPATRLVDSIEERPKRFAPQRLSQVRGLVTALVLLGLWAISLVSLLSLDFATLPLPMRVLGVLVQMFLYTGLFITAHDAMHGVVFPQNRRLNDAIGSLAVGLYALFDYKKLLQKHWQHHNYPASHFDPDFHNGRQRNFFAWYGNFMVNYWSWWRLFGLMATYNLVHIFLHVPEDNLRYFWVLPSILSSVQLFFFGTYLPHRQPVGGYTSPHRARSTDLAVIWSFLTCYHFGYHEEHHAQPHLPWWALPAARRQARGQNS